MGREKRTWLRPFIRREKNEANSQHVLRDTIIDSLNRKGDKISDKNSRILVFCLLGLSIALALGSLIRTIILISKHM